MKYLTISTDNEYPSNGLTMNIALKHSLSTLILPQPNYFQEWILSWKLLMLVRSLKIYCYAHYNLVCPFMQKLYMKTSQNNSSQFWAFFKKSKKKKKNQLQSNRIWKRCRASSGSHSLNIAKYITVLFGTEDASHSWWVGLMN